MGMIEKQAGRRRQVVIGNLLTNKVLLRDGQGADWSFIITTSAIFDNRSRYLALRKHNHRHSNWL